MPVIRQREGFKGLSTHLGAFSPNPVRTRPMVLCGRQRDLRSLLSPGPSLSLRYTYQKKIGRLIISPSSWPWGLVSSKVERLRVPFLVLHMALYTLLGRGRGSLYLRCSLPSTRLLSAFHSHSYVPWWSFLDPAPSINWRRRTPAHQDGSHSESRTPRAASVETLPAIPCLQTHAILATALLPVFPFPDDESISVLGKPRICHLNFCNKAHMSRRCWLIFSCTSSPGKHVASRSAPTSTPFLFLSSLEKLC